MVNKVLYSKMVYFFNFYKRDTPVIEAKIFSAHQAFSLLQCFNFHLLKRIIAKKLIDIIKCDNAKSFPYFIGLDLSYDISGSGKNDGF